VKDAPLELGHLDLEGRPDQVLRDFARDQAPEVAARHIGWTIVQVGRPGGAGLAERGQELVAPAKRQRIGARRVQAGPAHELGIVHDVEADIFRPAQAGENVEASMQVGHGDVKAIAKTPGREGDHRLDRPPIGVFEIGRGRDEALPVLDRGQGVLAPARILAEDQLGAEERRGEVGADVGQVGRHIVAQDRVRLQAGEDGRNLEFDVEPPLPQGGMGGARRGR